jgi:hypothetical protein
LDKVVAWRAAPAAGAVCDGPGRLGTGPVPWLTPNSGHDAHEELTFKEVGYTPG